MTDSPPLTKGQRRRRNEKLKKEQIRWWNKEIGPMPEYIKEFIRNDGGNISPIDMSQLEAWERAPNHMVEYGECPSIDVEAQKNLTKTSAEVRRDIKQEYITELRYRYPKHWGKRGGAKYIASKETEAGNPISVRTIQRYLKK